MKIKNNIHPDDMKTIFNKDWRMNHFYKIVDKNAKLITFKRNDAQNELAENKTGRDLIPKARQRGVTTHEVIESLDDCLFKKNVKCGIFAHEKLVTTDIFRKAKIAYENIPDEIKLRNGLWWKKPKTSYDNKNQYLFAENNSEFFVSVDYRGGTLYRAHCSEVSKWKNVNDRMAGILEAVPENGKITIESTGNGVGNWFHIACEDADDEENEFKLHFLSWLDQAEYKLKPLPNFKLTNEEHDEWKRLCTIQKEKGKPKVTANQMYWRRLKKKRQKQLFEQEYPSVLEECFLYTGRPVFNNVLIKEWTTRDSADWREIKEIIKERIIDDNFKIKPQTLSLMKDDFSMWIPPELDHEYVIGADIAEGILKNTVDSGTGKDNGADFTVIDILDRRTMQQVAQYRGKVPYGKAHLIIIAMARIYNFAFIGCERNNHGLTVVNNLSESNYDQNLIYTEEIIESKSQQKKRKRWGWLTSKKTRPVMIDDLCDMIDIDGIKVFSKFTQKECMRFVVSDDGKMEAQEGYHDDTVFSLGIAYQMIKRTAGQFRKLLKFNKNKAGF